jgi:ATP-GRASP peptide maturase of grasp-with-spasm system
LEKKNLSSAEKLRGVKQLLESSLKIEMGRILSYLHSILRKVNHIGGLYLSEINKLHVLNTCRELDIAIPASLVATRKSRLLQFFDKYEGVITKAATSTIFAGNGEVHLAAYTEAIDFEMLSGLPDEFAPSFFQERIEKLVEIRSVYLENEFYSMAIFSQRNKKTQVDFRHYDRSLPNRRVPFVLPQEYSEKVKSMLNKFNLNCCSVDTLVSRTGKFYFLEVNPVGQFGMTSYPCNYQIEKRIAEFLLK